MASFGLHCVVEEQEGRPACNVLRVQQLGHLSVEEIRALDYAAVRGSCQGARDFLREIQPITGTAPYRVRKT